MTSEETKAARRALSCVSHELTSPLSALSHFLRMAADGEGQALAAAVRCVDRLRDITWALRAAANVTDSTSSADLGQVLADTATTHGHRLVLAKSQHLRATDRLELAANLALTAVARTADDGSALVAEVVEQEGIVHVRTWIDGKQPGDWRAVDPLGETRHGLELWLAALTVGAGGGHVQVAHVDGTVAVALALPHPAELTT